jgi:dihydrofolate reductase
VISIVVARARNGAIGREGGLPWHLPSDMRQFRELTTGGVVIMGRRTFESLPSRYRPLPDRHNLVLSTNAELELPGAEVCADLPSALEACERECFVIGGAVVYRETLALAGRVHATEIEQELDGDAFFPELPPSEWRCVKRSERMVENELAFTFAAYERTSQFTV